ncbi:LysR family transcriptional regulator [Paracoccus yeei]|uniref:LysR family transcriptional regulator n=1 Tax=Paracoccus yeei TaxID=147645 RepID=UPI003BF78CE0
MRKLPSWDDHRVFLAVIETGSLAGAARHLGLSHPTVRQRIEALEARIGTPLFTRSGTGLTATAQALALAAPARSMAFAAELFGRIASAPASEAGGIVRLSVSEYMGIEVVPPVLARLRQHHPALTVELVLSNARSDLLGQEVDVALRHIAPVQEALVAQRLLPIPLGLFAARAYLDRRGQPATIRDLVHHDVIGPDRNTGDARIAEMLMPGHRPADLALRTDSHPAQAAAARAGLGIVVMQVPVGEADPRLVRVLPDLQVAELPLFVVTHENLRAVPRVRAVFEALVKELGRKAEQATPFR